MSFSPERLLEEAASATSKHAVEDIVDTYRDELNAMKPADKEQLLRRVADLFYELPE
jgi:hypothetical protein